MIFDYRPLITLDPEEAQLNEGGSNQWDNCGAAYYAQVLKWLGNGDPFEPQQIMDMIHGVNYHGGEVSRNLINFFNAHRDKYPKLPPIMVEQGGDIVIRARQAAASKFPTTNWWWCNNNGDIQPRNTGILHWSGVIFDDGAALGVWNIMRGQIVPLPYAFARAAYAGEFTTFRAALGGDNVQPDDVQKVSAAALRGAVIASMGRQPTSAQYDAMLGYIGGDISRLETQMVGATDSQEARDWLKALHTAVEEAKKVPALEQEVAALRSAGGLSAAQKAAMANFSKAAQALADAFK